MLAIRLSNITGSNSCALCQYITKKRERNYKSTSSIHEAHGADKLERKLKEKEVKLIRLLDEEEHQRGDQRELVNKLEQKQVLNGEKIEQDEQESELHNQVGDAVIDVRPK